MATNPTPRPDMVIYPDGTGYVVYPDGTYRSLDANQVALLVEYLNVNPGITSASVALGNLDSFFGQPAYSPTSPSRPSGGVVTPPPGGVVAVGPTGTTTTTTTTTPGGIADSSVPVAPVATPTGPSYTPVPESARAIIASILGLYGLESLTDLAFSEITAGETINADRLFAILRGTSEYKARFAGNEMRRAAGMNVLSEAEYLAAEDGYRQLLRAAGMPAGFYDGNDDYITFIANDVSIAELSQRLQNGYVAMLQADQSVKDQLREFYGLTDGELAAYFIDPNVALPLIEVQVASARMGAAAARVGIDVALNQAEQLAKLGISEQSAVEGFGRIAADMPELYQPLDSSEQEITLQEGIDATLIGNAAAARRIRQRRQQRIAEFQGGGRYATQGSEIVGLRNA